jgi:Zn-dependent protease
MPSAGQGSIRLFRFSGIDVFLHWSWFFALLYFVNDRSRGSSALWNGLVCLALFLIVMLHEFGHALACRQVGGRANQIVLWPLGGVAFVDPPQRPGATLWSIAAGPLVNVAMLPAFKGLLLVARSSGWEHAMPDVYAFLSMVEWINRGLLVFNILPVYPLDGGQILRSLLWFVLGRARSLQVATILGFVGVAGFILLAIVGRSRWLAIIAFFMLLNCWGGLRQAQALLRFSKLPRRDGFVCPACKNAPPVGELWKCGRCGQSFDMFQDYGTCSHCGAQIPATRCVDCGTLNSMSEWRAAAVAPANL